MRKPEKFDEHFKHKFWMKQLKFENFKLFSQVLTQKFRPDIIRI